MGKINNPNGKKGRQVNFYLNNLDLEKVEKYLEKIGFQIIIFDSQKPKKIQILTNLQAQKNLPSTRFLVLPNQQKDLKFDKNSSGFYRLSESSSPVIEYSLTFCSEKMMRSGRFYYKPFLYADQTWQAQNEVFLEKAEKLFRWFKRNFKRQAGEPFYNFYASAEVVKMAENMRFNGEKQCIEVL